jgi:hypothetical protein
MPAIADSPLLAARRTRASEHPMRCGWRAPGRAHQPVRNSEEGTYTALSLVPPSAWAQLAEPEASLMEVVRRMLAPLESRIRLMLSRAVVSLINDAARGAGIAGRSSGRRNADGVERWQNYGFPRIRCPAPKRWWAA